MAAIAFKIMFAKFLIDNISYSVDFSSFNDLSIPINFNGKQPNTYGVDNLDIVVEAKAKEMALQNINVECVQNTSIITE